MSEPRDGDRVRVTLEGTYKKCGGRRCERITLDAGRSLHFHETERTSIEVIAPSEPDWWPPRIGDIILWNCVWMRDDHDTWYSPGMSRTDDAVILREAHAGHVQLLVRGGRPVHPTGIVTIQQP